MTQPADPAPQPSPAPKPSKNPLKRLATTTLIALLAGTAAAAIAFVCLPPSYQCTGMIFVRPVIQPLLSGPAAAMPMYEQFVDSQVVLLKSERCADAAMCSPRWLDVSARSTSANASRNFQDGFEISSHGEVVTVTFQDPDPKTATDAVAALIESYQQLNIDLDPDNSARRQAMLLDLKTKYEKDLEDSRQRTVALASPYTPLALENRYYYKLTEADQAETAYRTSALALENWNALHAVPPDPASRAQLQTQTESTKTRFDALQSEANALGSKVTQIADLTATTQQKIEWLKETKQKLEETNISLSGPGRIMVLSQGDRPRLINSQKLHLSATLGIAAFLATLITAALLPRSRRA